MQDEIRKLEESLLTVEVRSSAEALDGIVSDEFVEFGSSGRTYTKRDVIAQMLTAPSVVVGVTDFKVQKLTADVALATYRTEGSLRSSIWRREGDRWRIIFHQGTAILKAT